MNEIRLIDANALKENLFIKFGNQLPNGLLEEINNTPTAEYPFYQEAYQTGYEEGKNDRPKGKWLSLSDVSPSGFGTWVCSQCGHGFRGIKSKMPYCTCGADMRGE